MARGDYERLTPEAIDQVWVRMGPVRRRSRRLGSWVWYRRRCAPICCAVAGSDPSRADERRSAVGSRNARRSRVAWRLAGRCVRSRPAWAGAVDGESGGRRQRWSPRLSGGGCRAAGVDQSRPAEACKLAEQPVLRDIVAEKLRRRWSPQQIAGWLKPTYPETRRCRCRTRASTAPCSCSPAARYAGSWPRICGPAG